MHKISRSALVPYSADQMYALVEDVVEYPDFLPWCKGAELHFKEDRVLEASLRFSHSGVSKTFRTRNDLQRGQQMTLELVDGPFQALSGQWDFEQLGEDGCKVSLAIRFEFRSALLDRALGRYFERICNSLIDSFTVRAGQLYAGQAL